MLNRKKAMTWGKGLDRGTSQLKRGKAMRRESPKHRKRRIGWQRILDEYFQRAKDSEQTAKCQSCQGDLERDLAHPHHKLLRSEHGTDEPENFLVLCGVCHILFIHDNQMGAQTPKAKERCEAARKSDANSVNCFRIIWSAEMAVEMEEIKRRWS